MRNLNYLINEFFSLFSNMTFKNILDIGLLTFIFYKVSKITKDTKAEQLSKGLLVILCVLEISKSFGFIALTWLIQSTLNFGVIAVIVIFQPEFRRVLERLGQTTLSSRQKDFDLDYSNIINSIERAVFDMSKEKTGALIVMARKYNLNEFIDKGTKLDAEISYHLIMNSFVDGTPLHDGALIIQDGRIKAGNCILPLTEQEISSLYGTRHRAGIGISEKYDCISIVVSEETGEISICINGCIEKYTDKIKFRAKLSSLFCNDLSTSEKKVRFSWKRIAKKI